MKRLFVILLLACALPASAQTTWEYRSTLDLVWTDMPENVSAPADTAIMHIVAGLNDMHPGKHPLTRWKDLTPEAQADWHIRGPDGYSGGRLAGVTAPHDGYHAHFVFTADSAATGNELVTFGNDHDGATLYIDVHVVADRTLLPEPSSGKVSFGVTDEPLIECDLPDGQVMLTLDDCVDRWNNIVFAGPGATLDVGPAPDHYNVVLEGGAVSLEAYPNPFNPMTTIAFRLMRAQRVRVQAYNNLGQSVKILVDRHMSAGLHHVDFDGSGLPSGQYIAQVVVGGWQETLIITLTK